MNRSFQTLLRASLAKAFIIWWMAVGGLIGWLAWGQAAGLGPLLLLLGLPFAYGLTGSRWAAGVLMAGYYLAGARGLPGGSAVFFGEVAPWWHGWALWVGASLLLSVPFVVLWSPKSAARGWRFVLAIVVVTVPPVGLIGWCSPLAVSGVLFPGAGWMGLALLGGLMGLLTMWQCVPRQALSVIAVAGIVAGGTNWIWQAPIAPQAWYGIDTAFPRLSSGGDWDAGQLLAAMKRVQWVKELAVMVPANRTVLLPETLLGPFGGMAEVGLMEVEQGLASRGSRILVGAEVPQADGRYVNGLVVLGAGAEGGQRPVLRQAIPVPVAMWMPWSNEGAAGDLWGRDAMLEVGGVRAGVLICYEQLLPWVILLRAAERPVVFLAASNVWWARDTSIPTIQRETVEAFGRLFGVAVVEAVNS